MKGRLTVLYPITDLDQHGAQRQLLELVKGIDKRRFRPVVLAMSAGGALEAEFKAIPGARTFHLVRKGKFDILYLFRVARVLRRLKVDVVQPFLTPATLFGLLPALLSRTPVKVVTERLAQRQERLGQSLYRRAEDFLSRFADRAVANSRAGREYLVARHIRPDKASVIYNGLNLDRLDFKPAEVAAIRRNIGVSPEGNVIGMIARLFPQKHHAIFLQAGAIISRTAPDTKFALVGEGHLREELENLTRDLGLASKVVFCGERKDIGNYLAAFDIVVLTSESEGCSNTLLEAMALAKPVVATDVGGNRELVDQGENGRLVPFGDAEAVAEAVLSLISDPQTARAMGQKAKDKVYGQFNLGKMVKQYESLYDEAFKGKRRPERIPASRGRHVSTRLASHGGHSQGGEI